VVSGGVVGRAALPGGTRLAAHVKQVAGTNRRATLGRAPAQVTLVEHVLAALAGLRIDNCTVELDAGEPPGLDGSARGFVEALVAAGGTDQPESRAGWGAAGPGTVRPPGAPVPPRPPPAGRGTRPYLSALPPHRPLAPT